MKQQELTPASAQEIEAFQKGAADRFQQLGLKPDVANAVYTTYLSKAAADLGLADPQTEKQAKVNALKQRIKQALGR